MYIDISLLNSDFPGGSDGKSVCLQCRRPGFDHCVGKILWRRKWQPTTTLTWKIPWMEESGKLQSVGLQRVGQDWVTSPYLTLPYWIVFYHTVVEKAMAPHSSTLAWKIPWTEEPGRLQSMVLLRVGHDFTFTFHFDALEKKWQPTPVFLPGVSQGRGSVVGCCLWGCTESDTTEAT